MIARLCRYNGQSLAQLILHEWLMNHDFAVSFYHRSSDTPEAERLPLLRRSVPLCEKITHCHAVVSKCTRLIFV